MQNNTRPLVLIIAGVDSGGGAGVTADCISVMDNGAYPLNCVTALTCQSLSRVSLIEKTPLEIFEQTLLMAKTDWPEGIGAIKVGVVTHEDILQCLLNALENELCNIPVIWDPVLTATAGNLQSANIKASLKRILKCTSIFTPNLPEALELASWSMDDYKQKGGFALGEYFLEQGAKCVIIKGGHNSDTHEAQDAFISKNLQFLMVHKKINEQGAHGGGCALSSALAALVANNYAFEDAAVLAKAYVYRGIKEPFIKARSNRPPLGHHGFVDDYKDLPHIIEPGFPTSSGPFEKCPDNLGLYPVLDSEQWVSKVISMGVKTVQLRIKNKEADLKQKIKDAVFYAKQAGARLFIDDHYQEAIEAGAYGVHLGMEDLKEANLDAILKAKLRLGVSTHGPYELAKALTLKPSYIALGHIFPTNSKQMPSKPQGIDKLTRQLTMLKGSIPTVAIGGINMSNIDAVLATGVGSIALITAITKADDWAIATSELIKKCGVGDE